MSPEKEEKLRLYFESLKLPESQWISESSLGLTQADIFQYQQMKEEEVSMKPDEKRNVVVREVLKPMMKKSGFKCKRMDWWKELDDGFLFIHMKNSRFNSGATGNRFCFQFSASYKDDIADKIENQWICNQMSCIEEAVFLPYCGYLVPNRSAFGYKIDGYKSFLPSDIPVEEIKAQIQEDFDLYILPEIENIKTVCEFEALAEKKRERCNEKEVKLLRFFSLMHTSCCTDSNIEIAIRTLEQFELSEEDIRAHYDWLGIIAKNSSLPHLDARNFIEKVLSMK